MLCSSTGSSCAAIAGATAQTFTLTAADVGGTIVLPETATNAGGNSSSAYSALTSVITTPAGIVPVPVSSSPPTVSGTPQQGQTLHESHAAWSNNPGSYGYQWERCGSSGCSAIPGATGQTYTLTTYDVGDTILVQESATNTGGTGATVASAHTAVVSATSSTSLVASPNTLDTNQTITLVTTVTSSSGNAGPSGSVSFFDLYTPISGCTNEGVKSSSQTVTVICQTSFPASTALITAVYKPGAGSLVTGSSSPVTTLNVGRDSTSTSLAVTKKVLRDKRATYTATVVLPVSNSGPIQPIGSIEFFDKGHPIRGCVSRPLSQLGATCTMKYTKLGKHDIYARYSGDSNFTASSSPTRSVQIVNKSTDPVVLGFISSTVLWTFNYHPAYTQVAALHAYGIAPAATVVMNCLGRGCPFTKLKFSGASGSTINLGTAFHHRHLRVGSQITIRITRPHFIGKYYLITVRAGNQPLATINCLAVGGTLPRCGLLTLPGWLMNRRFPSEGIHRTRLACAAAVVLIFAAWATHVGLAQAAGPPAGLPGPPPGAGTGFPLPPPPGLAPSPEPSGPPVTLPLGPSGPGLLSGSAGLSGARLNLRVACQAGGRAAFRAAQLAGGTLASARYKCARGRATVSFSLARRIAQQITRSGSVLGSVVFTQGGGNERVSLDVGPHSPAPSFWTSFFGLQCGASGSYQAGLTAPNFTDTPATTIDVRPWLAWYTAATGWQWLGTDGPNASSWYRWTATPSGVAEWRTSPPKLNPWTWGPITVSPGHGTYVIAALEAIYWYSHPVYVWEYAHSYPSTTYCAYN